MNYRTIDVYDVTRKTMIWNEFSKLAKCNYRSNFSTDILLKNRTMSEKNKKKHRTELYDMNKKYEALFKITKVFI